MWWKKNDIVAVFISYESKFLWILWEIWKRGRYESEQQQLQAALKNQGEEAMSCKLCLLLNRLAWCCHSKSFMRTGRCYHIKRTANNGTKYFSRWTTCFCLTLDCLWQKLPDVHSSYLWKRWYAAANRKPWASKLEITILIQIRSTCDYTTSFAYYLCHEFPIPVPQAFGKRQKERKIW